ncbi:hypothetical protein MMC10_010538 [Thelotrema lepadinum]|nr:hypothetical protein [Thelotrema lepadinum]
MSDIEQVVLPTITLDTTLSELYRRAGGSTADTTIGQVLCGTNLGVSLSEVFPRNTKYIYQATPFNNIPPFEELNDDDRDPLPQSEREYVSMIPQRDAFVCGNMPVVLFNADTFPEDVERDRQEAEKTIEVLDPKQQPTLIFCPGPGHIPQEDHCIDMFAYNVVLDQLAAYPTTFDFDKHWHINSREALARSHLPTPKYDFIEVSGRSADMNSCCSRCYNAAESLFIPFSCTGCRRDWADEQVSRIFHAVSRRPIPFVMKTQQAYGGAGTYIITQDSDRNELIKAFTSDLFHRVLSSITPENMHMKPGSVLISEFDTDPVGNYGLSFFVTVGGGAIFVGVSEQLTDVSNGWTGATIEYGQQKSLEAKLNPLMQGIAAWLWLRDYIGPVEAYVVETAAEEKAQEAPDDELLRDEERPAQTKAKGAKGKTVKMNKAKTELQIVDLAARVSGNLCLPLLRGHFEKRKLKCATSFSIILKRGREHFLNDWKEELEAGTLCIVGWCEDKMTEASFVDLVLAAKNRKVLQDETDRMKEVERVKELTMARVKEIKRMREIGRIEEEHIQAMERNMEETVW